MTGSRWRGMSKIEIPPEVVEAAAKAIWDASQATATMAREYGDLRPIVDYRDADMLTIARAAIWATLDAWPNPEQP